LLQLAALAAATAATVLLQLETKLHHQLLQATQQKLHMKVMHHNQGCSCAVQQLWLNQGMQQQLLQIWHSIRYCLAQRAGLIAAATPHQQQQQQQARQQMDSHLVHQAPQDSSRMQATAATQLLLLLLPAVPMPMA
jgi:hypothetical protein